MIIKFTKPSAADIHIREYLTRKGQRDMRKVMSKYAEIDFQELNKRIEAGEEKVTMAEQNALIEVSDSMNISMIEKIELKSGGTLTSESEIENFLDNSTAEEFAELTKATSKVINKKQDEAEKKTK